MTTPISTDLDALCVVYIPAVSVVCVQSALCYVYIRTCSEYCVYM